MKFEEALKLMRGGNKMRCKFWLKGSYIEISNCSFWDNEGDRYDLEETEILGEWEEYKESKSKEDKLDKIIKKCYKFFVSPRHQDFKGFWERTEYDELKLELEELE